MHKGKNIADDIIKEICHKATNSPGRAIVTERKRWEQVESFR